MQGENGEYIYVYAVDYYVSGVIFYDANIHIVCLCLCVSLRARLVCCVLCAFVSVCEVVKLKLHDVMKSICNVGDYEKLNIWKADMAFGVLVCVCIV